MLFLIKKNDNVFEIKNIKKNILNFNIKTYHTDIVHITNYILTVHTCLYDVIS